MVEVTVNASWRLARVELNLSYAVTGLILGYGEILLQESPGSGPEAASVFRQPRARSVFGEVDAKTYGSMLGATVQRSATPEVLAETIMIDDTEVSLENTLNTLRLFFEKWRIEDAEKPTGPPPIPEAAAVTPVPQMGELGKPPDTIVAPV